MDDEQVRCFPEYGYLSCIHILSDEQVERLRGELQVPFDPKHPGNDLFHEFHSNESPDPSRVLFHALGAWRIERFFPLLLIRRGIELLFLRLVS